MRGHTFIFFCLLLLNTVKFPSLLRKSSEWPLTVGYVSEVQHHE